MSVANSEEKEKETVPSKSTNILVPAKPIRQDWNFDFSREDNNTLFPLLEIKSHKPQH